MREGVINAFVNRDWTRPTDRMKLGLWVPRNPILIQTLRDYGYVEHMGMGVRNKIIPPSLQSDASNRKRMGKLSPAEVRIASMTCR